MFLLLIYSLSLATAQSSIINTLLSHNATQITQQHNALQNTLDFATRKLSLQAISSKVIDNSDTSKRLEPYNKDNWPSSNVFPGINTTSEYIIEYLGCHPHSSIEPQLCKSKKNKHAMHYYKITVKVAAKHSKPLFTHKLLILPLGPNNG